VESRKADKTRMEEAGREKRKERKKETHDRESKDDRKRMKRKI